MIEQIAYPEQNDKEDKSQLIGLTWQFICPSVLNLARTSVLFLALQLAGSIATEANR